MNQMKSGHDKKQNTKLRNTPSIFDYLYHLFGYPQPFDRLERRWFDYPEPIVTASL